ncbi:MAG: hypothetical protein LBL26_03410 [Peptococcaceae bacterium]|jgi:hypothetical protein|nr:hypothetical protein [Peptococcaceae bacterium]
MSSELMNRENNEMERSFRLPELTEGSEFSNEDLAEDMDGLRFIFQRVKIPSGGAMQFEIPGDDPENPEYERTIEGVILHHHAAHAYWPEGSEDEEDAVPLCSSVDGKLGAGEPGGDCVTCALNKFGTGRNGRGKACKNMRVLYLLRDGEYMPIQITLPPTSIKPFNDFYSAAFLARRRAAFGSVVSIGLKRENNGKDDYSVATFKKLYDFTGEQLAQVRIYADTFKSQIRLVNQQRAAEAMNRTDDEYSEYGGGDEERFNISTPGAYIDGDRERLPA